MDRIASAISRLEALADHGLSAERLADEMHATLAAWRAELDLEATRLKQGLGVLSLRHEDQGAVALRTGMAAEGRRQAQIAAALAQAIRW